MEDEAVPEVKKARLETSPPLYGSLELIYHNSTEKQRARYEKLNDLFVEKYGHAPAFYARAPGRVNIIGEHIDYCGYGVLPMALEQDIVIAASTNTDKMLHINNTNPEFQDFSVDTLEYQIDGKEWYHYFLCGYKGIVDFPVLAILDPVGMNLIVDGSVPKSAGLSSSSALVCCSALATLYANNLELTKHELAEICTKCEKYIGTEGGGMDQAISFLAERGTAKYVEFHPTRATDIKLPDGVAFVIANCLVEMKKSESAGTHFNVRVVECRTAAKYLAKVKGLEWRKIRLLREVQDELNLKLEDMVHLVESELKKEPYTKDELCKFFDITEEELIENCLSKSTVGVKSLKLHDRAKHVYAEADRVLKFKQICEENPPDIMKALGKLMDESFDSCRDLYECSCDELNELVAACREAGALGSRLTGAGWGGCTVSMVRTDALDDFISKVTKAYYSKPGHQERVEEALFATEPGSGAAVLCLD
ncbi:N-acetylgalactosamine kinase-like [Actinia tenebrosa]|uniref:N-acetylgalactosamine kinase-like n=1 Tax=Actinia tenebrosa TaxID=6105 RepID=A0A6P8HWA6_ACTTE|nr:N-acetylgalactosamine kinase-like [Actinia tenebrosa]